MAIKETTGRIRSVKIFFNQNTGEIKLRNKDGSLLTLKLSNDNVSAFNAMASVASCAIQFGNPTSNLFSTPYVRVRYNEDQENEIEWLQLQFNEFIVPPDFDLSNVGANQT